MAIILKDFDHVTVVDGELLPSSSSFDLEDLMGNFDYKRIIKMQFDRLDSNYQEFLTVRKTSTKTKQKTKTNTIFFFKKKRSPVA